MITAKSNINNSNNITNKSSPCCIAVNSANLN